MTLIVNYMCGSDGLVASAKAAVLPSEQTIIENGCHVIGTKVLLSSSSRDSDARSSRLAGEGRDQSLLEPKYESISKEERNKVGEKN